MALTFHRIDKAEVDRLNVGTEEEPAFRTAEGEIVVFEGATPEEAEAKAEDFLTWAA